MKAVLTCFLFILLLLAGTSHAAPTAYHHHITSTIKSEDKSRFQSSFRQLPSKNQHIADDNVIDDDDDDDDLSFSRKPVLLLPSWLVVVTEPFEDEESFISTSQIFLRKHLSRLGQDTFILQRVLRI